MIDVNLWIDRVENLLKLQKDLQRDTMSMTLTRRDLVELRTICNSLKQYEEIERRYK